MSIKKVVMYARYSTDMQNANSVEDQFRNCRRLLKGDEAVVASYSDSGISGSSILKRPGIQDLLELIENDPSIEVILAEGLDRLSRNQAQIAQIFSIAEFHGVSIRTILEGEVEDIHVGIKGTMNAIELKKMAERTRRGLLGVLHDGRLPTRLAYGYEPGEKNGERRINQEEAAIVRQIYNKYLEGESVLGIVKWLNNEGIKTQQGNKWSSNGIRGRQGNGAGILQNVLYKGVVIWNRYSSTKHPETGKKIRKENDASEWITREAPELRIIEEDVWNKVQAKLAQTYNPHRKGSNRRKTLPPLPFSLTCGACGGEMIRHNLKYLICKNQNRHGVCPQGHKIKYEEVCNEIMYAICSNPEQHFHMWKKKLKTCTPSIQDRFQLEAEINNLNTQIIKLEALRLEKQHELAKMPPAISDTPEHRQLFIDICKSAIEPDQIVSFITGGTVIHYGDRPVVEDLEPNWSSITKLTPANSSGRISSTTA